MVLRTDRQQESEWNLPSDWLWLSTLRRRWWCCCLKDSKQTQCRLCGQYLTNFFLCYVGEHHSAVGVVFGHHRSWVSNFLILIYFSVVLFGQLVCHFKFKRGRVLIVDFSVAPKIFCLFFVVYSNQALSNERRPLIIWLLPCYCY